MNAPVVSSLGQDISLILTKKNLTFHTIEAFLQAVPRKNYLAIILSLEYDDLPYEYQEICASTNDWSYITNASLSGIYYEIHTEKDLENLYPLLKYSYDEAL